MTDVEEALRSIDARLAAASRSRSMQVTAPVIARRARSEIDRLLDRRIRYMAARDEQDIAAFREWLHMVDGNATGAEA